MSWFANVGLIVINLARRKEKAEDLKAQLTGVNGKLVACEFDVSKKEAVKNAFEWIESELSGGVNILINNAGIAR